MRTATEDNRRLVDAYLDWQSSTRNCSPHTYAAYSGTLNKLVVHLAATPRNPARISRCRYAQGLEGVLSEIGTCAVGKGWCTGW